ncbi:HTH domain-containing protein [Bacillus sp. REN10]|uniref:helix-turn-helix transcriptional regulator n=1 Tax=Bacillus sp. REN10 TaxID=2782541 RepID=UPI00193C7A83|nr:HTH domain-containing protein [Bacillus sp. REN10]
MMKNRQLEILFYLLKAKKTTHRELANEFGVSIKTIQRDIDDLCAIGVPITCKQGNLGGVYISESYKLSRTFLNDQDMQSIIFALSMFDSISAKKQKESIVKKLALLAPELVHLLAHDAQEYFIVDVFDDAVDMSDDIYLKINDCLDEEYFLNVMFRGKRLMVAPISYVLRPDGMYLYAFAKEYVLLKISDLSDPQITEMTFERDFIPYKENKKIASK